jgi:hypothetical protein
MLPRSNHTVATGVTGELTEPSGFFFQRFAMLAFPLRVVPAEGGDPVSQSGSASSHSRCGVLDARFRGHDGSIC